ncbi:MAG: UDP-2,3-diacylglucosamine diphosphatase [Gammaproteobacteria bacterium]|nr:UDP-2,3-diacylglucosamine diphosphatase [Gammaproteobacteria bacterium]
MPTLLISDLHLQESQPRLSALFQQFMANIAPESEALYVLGDCFEAWVGDDDDSAFHRAIIGAFRRYSDSGKALYFLHGNRDFLLGEEFAQACGGQLLQGPVVHELGGQPTLLMHGDELCTDDAAYLAFRAQVRHPAWQVAFLAKPLVERHQIAAGLRAASKEAAMGKSESIMDVNDQAVLTALREHDVPRLIHGHTHRPAYHRPAAGRQRIVLGDWHERGCYLRIEPALSALCYFDEEGGTPSA